MKLDKSVATSHAVLFHSAGLNNFITLHEVKQGKIGSAKSCDTVTLMKMLSEVSTARIADGSTKSVTLLNPNIIYKDLSSIALWVPAKIHTMSFADGHGSKSVQKQIPLCAHLIVYTGKTVYVYALKENKRPTLNTKLYHTPVGNVYEASNLCVGSNVLPNINDPFIAEKIEDIAICSTSTSYFKDQPLKGIHGSKLKQFLFSLDGKAVDDFDTELLIEINSLNNTLESIL
jgi:PRTRC genetic system protein B